MTAQNETGVYARSDGKFAWRIVADNGQVTATDGSQGFSRRIDAERALEHQLGAAEDAPHDADYGGNSTTVDGQRWRDIGGPEN